MIISSTFTKKLLENLISESFLKFGGISSSSLLDSLKLLGFSYATSAGISINIEDLKTPDAKKNYIDEANEEISAVSYKWQDGFISDAERFQAIIDSWNIATESLKNKIIDYYENYDPTNNLYIMSSSGARGNMSQVRQLVGMRGLMSDQNGKIIDLPIQSNFREGLSTIDYIISSYGARKGIVDTALKTADSGYLTRRLIYIAQDLVIRQKDCGTKDGIIFLLKKSSNIKNLLGRFLISTKSEFNTIKKLNLHNIILTSSLLNDLKKKDKNILNIRSSLTCKANGSICQNCYGWDLSKNKLIALGEAVGIIAAQSIGEPGTQLTMRTFHTGGIFTGELLTQIRAPFSGKIIFPTSLKTIQYRTSHGFLALKLQQEISVILINWQGTIKEIFLDSGSFLYCNSLSFLKQGDLISESRNKSILPGARKLKPIFSPISGEIKFNGLLIKTKYYQKPSIKINKKESILWIASGKVMIFPKEISFFSLKYLVKAKPIASLNVLFPYQGIVTYSRNEIKIEKTDLTFFLNLNHFQFSIKNIFTKFSPFIRNFQYIDSLTFLGKIYFFPQSTGIIYRVRKKISKYKLTLFFVTENDIWKLYLDGINDFSLLQNKNSGIRSGTLINPTTRTKNSGFFLKKDGLKMIFQKTYPIFLSQETILNYKEGDFILEKKILANLVSYTQQTEDIVQGLPKIEELIEARRPKISSYLAERPGILMMPDNLTENRFHEINRVIVNNVIKCILKDDELLLSGSLKKKGQEKQLVYLAHSIFVKDSLILFHNKIYKISTIPSRFKINDYPNKKIARKPSRKKGEVYFENSNGDLLLINGKLFFSSWLRNKLEIEEFIFFLKNGQIKPFLSLSPRSYIFENKKNDLIISNEKYGYFFLEYLNPIVEYQIPLSSKIIFSYGNFIDLGEPFTEGTIDIHQLLHLFFKYHSSFDGLIKGSLKSLNKFQLLLVHSIQAIYQSQQVNISSKHIEIIVRQMTGKAVITDSGETPLLPGELIRLSILYQIYDFLKKSKADSIFSIPKFEPLLLSSTSESLAKDGFLSAAGFQETKRVLTKAAIEGSKDWLRGLKECIIIGRIIPAGSTFLNYKNYLDNVYLFKKKSN